MKNFREISVSQTFHNILSKFGIVSLHYTSIIFSKLECGVREEKRQRRAFFEGRAKAGEMCELYSKSRAPLAFLGPYSFSVSRQDTCALHGYCLRSFDKREKILRALFVVARVSPVSKCVHPRTQGEARKVTQGESKKREARTSTTNHLTNHRPWIAVGREGLPF